MVRGPFYACDNCGQMSDHNTTMSSWWLVQPGYNVKSDVSPMGPKLLFCSRECVRDWATK